MISEMFSIQNSISNFVVALKEFSLSLSLSPLNKTKLDWFTNKTYVRRLRRLL